MVNVSMCVTKTIQGEISHKTTGVQHYLYIYFADFIKKKLRITRLVDKNNVFL